MKLRFVLHTVYLLILSYFAYLLLLISLQYVPVKLDVAFLKIKEDALAYAYYPFVFYVHVYTSIWVLLIGILQLVPSLRVYKPGFHKLIGKIYVFLVLCFAAPSGFMMGLHANGGWIAIPSFLIQGVLWFGFTLIAFQKIKKGDLNAHRKFMLRSLALTFSAITLRLLKWGLTAGLGFNPRDAYQVVAWAGWGINLLIAESYIYFRLKH